MDFLNYWDTRIDANERFFNNYPHIANFAFIECQELWDRMSADYAALETERHSLAQEIMRQVNKNEELHARHNALREAVAKYLGVSDTAAMAATEDALTMDMLSNTVTARDEVDRLLEEK